jgi:hypothetical protein
MGVSGQHHAPATLYPRGKDPRYPLYRRLGWTQRLDEKSSVSVGDRTLFVILTELTQLRIHVSTQHNRYKSSTKNQQWRADQLFHD